MVLPSSSPSLTIISVFVCKLTTITKKIKNGESLGSDLFHFTHVEESVADFTEREGEMVSVASEETRRCRFLLARRRRDYVEEDYDVTLTEEVMECPLQRRPRRFFIFYNHHDPPYVSHYYSLSLCVWSDKRRIELGSVLCRSSCDSLSLLSLSHQRLNMYIIIIVWMLKFGIYGCGNKSKWVECVFVMHFLKSWTVFLLSR